jgi:hypothetical protein
VDKKFGTRNRNLGKMARFRNTAGGSGNWNGEEIRREWGGGGQFTNNLGPGWTRIAPRKEEGFQVSKKDLGERGN